MLQETSNHYNNLEELIQELDGITGDVSKYVNFLVARQDLMQKVLLDGPASNN